MELEQNCCAIDLRGGRGIGNGSYRRVSLSYSFVVPLMKLICNIMTSLKILDISQKRNCMVQDA